KIASKKVARWCARTRPCVDCVFCGSRGSTKHYFIIRRNRARPFELTSGRFEWLRWARGNPAPLVRSRSLNELLEVFPANGSDVVVLESLLEIRGHDEVEVALAPRRTVVVIEAKHDGAQFGIVVAEVNKHFGQAGLQSAQRIQIKLLPFSGLDLRR